MIRTISYAALALFLVSVPASVLAQNAPASDPATQPPATALPDATAKESPPKPVEGQMITQDKVHTSRQFDYWRQRLFAGQ